MKMITDYKKYKRFFSFGCSFTSYNWPTWSDLLSKEMPDCMYYNCGKPGAGNQFISYKVAEINQKYNFNKDDLVIILWSTFTREDKYINDEWLTYGNIYNNPLYDDRYIEKYVDEKGFIYRDLALMELVDGYLKNQCDYIGLLSVPPVIGSENPRTLRTDRYSEFDDLNEKFYKLLVKFPKSLFEVEFPNGWDINYSHTIDGGHPSSIRYFNYLQKIGFKLSQNTQQYALECSEFLRNAKSIAEVKNHFKECQNYKL